MIEITMLGTSALLPLPDRAETALTLNCAGHTILFDCGEGTQCAARKAGVSLMKTDMIALTHYHGDHIFGLPGLLQTMTMMGRTEKLYIAGPEGIHEALAPIIQLVGSSSYEIELMEMPSELQLSSLIKGWPPEAKLTSFRTEHRVPSIGYCFILNRSGRFMPQRAIELGIPNTMWGLLQKGETVSFNGGQFMPEQVLGEPRKGLKFVFSGDTAVCDALVHAAESADLLVCEGTYGENEQAQLASGHGHMNFEQAAQTAAKAGAAELWLTHYSQMIKDPELYLPNAVRVFENTLCSRDGMRKVLRFEKVLPEDS